MYWCRTNTPSYRLFLSSVSDPDKRLQALWVVCDQLPKNNKTNLRLVVHGALISSVEQDCVYPEAHSVFIQVSGEVFSQTGSRQWGEQNDSQQHRYRPGTQPAVDEDWGVRFTCCKCFKQRRSLSKNLCVHPGRWRRWLQLLLCTWWPSWSQSSSMPIGSFLKVLRCPPHI